MIRALSEYDVGGIRTNIGFFRQILEDPVFRDGCLHTGFIDEFFARTAPPVPPPELATVAALAAAIHATAQTAALAPAAAPASRWLDAGRTELLR
jgi:acetyl-CoA carboxylase biotin carboxylase subunit